MEHAPVTAVILAAGKGTRMRSDRPKPLHHLCGRPMVLYVVDALSALRVDRVVVVVGNRAEWVSKTVLEHAPEGMRFDFVEQVEQLGTGDAVKVALTCFGDDDPDDLVVLPGDTPLLRPPTIGALMRAHREQGAAATLLTARVSVPSGYGRVLRGRDNHVVRVVEDGDATDEELRITEINTSIYCFKRSLLSPAFRPSLGCLRSHGGGGD
ncbi:MAG: NTP transferase domain-containing protein [Actinobacteria bacterium]|nr:NTP transferase domain-containing protein [Actinomycetota bacterium]